MVKNYQKGIALRRIIQQFKQKLIDQFKNIYIYNSIVIYMYNNNPSKSILQIRLFKAILFKLKNISINFPARKVRNFGKI